MTPTAELPVFGTASAAFSAFTLGMRRNLANWPILMGRALFYLVAITVLTALWDKVAAARLAGTLATTLPPDGLTLYFGTTEWITLSTAAIHLRLEDDIRFGMLEPHLLRPKPYLVQRIAETVGDSVARLIGIGIAAVIALLLSGRTLPPVEGVVFALLLSPLGLCIGVLLLVLTGLCAFWVRRVLPPYIIMQKIIFLLGGLFAPISLYPGWFYRLAMWTPFPGYLYLIGNQMIHPSAKAFAESFVLQVFWFAVLAGLVALVWRAGLRKVLREGV
ncbi:MAG: ABC-2 family transporter protein [Proteobacteria bacterium]|nr:ABC-2 family transporter protein [Pseudomonadota bacterium]